MGRLARRGGVTLGAAGAALGALRLIRARARARASKRGEEGEGEGQRGGEGEGERGGAQGLEAGRHTAPPRLAPSTTAFSPPSCFL